MPAVSKEFFQRHNGIQIKRRLQTYDKITSMLAVFMEANYLDVYCMHWGSVAELLGRYVSQLSLTLIT